MLLEDANKASSQLLGEREWGTLTRMIFWRFFQVSSRASMVNQVYGLGPTLNDLICLSSAASWLKSDSAALRDALNWSWASRRAYIKHTHKHITPLIYLLGFWHLRSWRVTNPVDTLISFLHQQHFPDFYERLLLIIEYLTKIYHSCQSSFYTFPQIHQFVHIMC